MRILKELRASQFVNADSKALAESGFSSRDGRDRVSEWELLVYTQQFSQEWQAKELRETENERVRKRLKTKSRNGEKFCWQSRGEMKSGDFGRDTDCSVQFTRYGSTEYTDFQLLTT
jgi:hypothetical protein